MVNYIKDKNDYYKIDNSGKKTKITKDKYINCISKKFQNIILPEPKVENNVIINIAFPSINRPKIIEENIKSLVKYLKGVDFKNSKIYVNMDPVPIIFNIEESEKLVKKYIPNVVINYSKKPSYPKAYLWTLNQCCINHVESNLFLFLPDDWEFINYININDVIEKFKNNTDIKSISINNDWEFGITSFGNNINKHKKNEKDLFRSTPAFYLIDYFQSVYDKIEAIPCPIEGSLNNYCKKINQCKISMWLSNEQLYYCIDKGEEWKKSNNIPGDMIHKCGKYKLCSICGKVNYNFICKKNNGEDCEYNNYICSYKCYDKHLEYFHPKNKINFKLEKKI
jgi:hypothetical protein